MKWKTGGMNRTAICLAVFAFFALTGCGTPAAAKKSTATISFLPSLQPSATVLSTPTATLIPEKAWKNYGPESGLIHALALDPSAPSILYAGTDDAGVYKSTDGSGEWTAVNAGLTAMHINTLAVDPKSSGTLFAGTDDGGIFRTVNGGENWIALNNGLTANRIKSVVIDPVTPATLYAGTDAGIFVSKNEGASWDGINHGLLDQNVDALVIDPAKPTTLYAGTIGEGVFMSTDGGGSWNPVNNGLTAANVYALTIDPSTPALLCHRERRRNVECGRRRFRRCLRFRSGAQSVGAGHSIRRDVERRCMEEHQRRRGVEYGCHRPSQYPD